MIFIDQHLECFLQARPRFFPFFQPSVFFPLLYRAHLRYGVQFLLAQAVPEKARKTRLGLGTSRKGEQSDGSDCEEEALERQTTCCC